MLVLSRKINQSIIIDDKIEVIVLDVVKDQIKIGIKAPREITVLRKEIYLEIQAENISASQAGKNVNAVEEMLKKPDK
jgi:carbon storage regulator